MDAYYVGVGTGLIVGILCVYFLAKKHRKLFPENMYDERQLLEQGRAYKYGFFTALILNLLICVFIEPDTEQDIRFIWHLVSLVISVLVFAIYAIWKDAYVGFTYSAMKYYRLGGLIAVFLLVIAGIEYFAGDCQLDSGVMTCLLVSFLWFAIILALWIRSHFIQEEHDEE